MTSHTDSPSKRPGPTEEPPTRGHRAVVGDHPTTANAPSAAAAAASQVYQVAVYTGDIPDAGTDADIWLWVDGSAGRSGWRFLDNADDNFERGRTDYFYLNLPDLGFLSAAWIWFSRSGGKPGWFLSTVVVNGKTFSYYNWIENTGLYRLTSA